MSLLPWALLASTLTVRALLVRKSRWAWKLDLCTVPAWLLYYASHGDWQLCAIPLLFGAMTVRALRREWR